MACSSALATLVRYGLIDADKRLVIDEHLSTIFAKLSHVSNAWKTWDPTWENDYKKHLNSLLSSLRKAENAFYELDDLLIGVLERDATAYALGRLRWVDRELGTSLRTTGFEAGTTN